VSRLAEVSLVQNLTDEDSLAYFVREGLDLSLISTDALRAVVAYAEDYYTKSGYRTAPTVAVLREKFGDELDHHEVNLDAEPEATIEWAIEELKGSWIYAESSTWTKDFILDVAKASAAERPDALARHADLLLRISNGLDSRIYRSGVREGSQTALRNYEDRAGTSEIRGLRFGLEQVDRHTFGVHGGELAIVAAGPKIGKSFFLAHTALTEWNNGRDVILFTLENTIDMTWDRIACMACGVSYRAWQAGSATPEDLERIHHWLAHVETRSNQLIVAQPPPGRRSFDAMLGEARVHGVQSVLVDQLTFVEMPDPRKAKTERIGDALHRLKAQLNHGRGEPLSCVLAHQVNREGVKSAERAGHLEMYFMADSAEIERTADMVFGIYASRDDKAVRRAKLQVLAARRFDPRNWDCRWNVDLGIYSAINEFTISAS